MSSLVRISLALITGAVVFFACGKSGNEETSDTNENGQPTVTVGTNPDIKNPIVTNPNSGVGGGGTTDGSDGSGEDDGSSEPGDTEALSVTQRGATSISISWVARAGSAADPTQWQYKVVKAGVVDDLDTVEKADAATTAMDWTANVSSSEITGLTEGTSYAFNVLAKDAEGNVTIYTPTAAHTTPDLSAFDPSFEAFDGNGSDNIGKNGYANRILMSDTHAHQGSQSVRFEDVEFHAIRFPSHMHPTRIRVVSGQAYTLRAWVYIEKVGASGTADDISITVKPAYYANGLFASTGTAIQQGTPALDQWTMLEFSFTPPVGVDAAYLEFRADADAAHELDMFLDNFSLVEAEN